MKNRAPTRLVPERGQKAAENGGMFAAASFSLRMTPIFR